MNNLSFVTPIAYDYKYAFDTIKAYYDIADEIILGLDADRISWSQKEYPFDNEEFFGFIKEIDKDNKIRVIEDDYHSFPKPIVNDTQERQHLANQCKAGNWVIQIDSDELILNPKEFKSWMQPFADKKCRLLGEWITVFKIFGDKVLAVKRPRKAMVTIGSIQGTSLSMCRDTHQEAQDTPMVMFHNSWGRTRDELKRKLENWGHSVDFDTDAYLTLWESVNMENYTEFTDLHPLHGPNWPKLEVLNLKDYK